MGDSSQAKAIDVVETGLVFRNPKPYLRAINAWHPSIVRLDSGVLLSLFDLGQAVESLATSATMNCGSIPATILEAMKRPFPQENSP